MGNTLFGLHERGQNRWLIRVPVLIHGCTITCTHDDLTNKAFLTHEHAKHWLRKRNQPILDDILDTCGPKFGEAFSDDDRHALAGMLIGAHFAEQYRVDPGEGCAHVLMTNLYGTSWEWEGPHDPWDMRDKLDHMNTRAVHRHVQDLRVRLQNLCVYAAQHNMHITWR